MKLAVVLFNLGGPDSPAAVRPFLRNLFSDPAIIKLPALLRNPLARLIAWQRAPFATKFYGEIGGRSPLLEETNKQKTALEAALAEIGFEAKGFIAMRYWHPFTDEAVAAVKEWRPKHIVLLPLYPQFSTTTTASSFAAWRQVAARENLAVPTHVVCCYPNERGFVAALAALTEDALIRIKPGISYRVLFSAHGLPQKIVDLGEPYPSHVERTVAAVVAALKHPGLDWQICYQSRVGPLKWIGPETVDEIRRAGAEGKGVIVVPVAFVSEHSETLVELDINYSQIARDSGVTDYMRVPTVRTDKAFIRGLAESVSRALQTQDGAVSSAGARLCAQGKFCAYGESFHA